MRYLRNSILEKKLKDIHKFIALHEQEFLCFAARKPGIMLQKQEVYVILTLPISRAGDLRKPEGMRHIEMQIQLLTLQKILHNDDISQMLTEIKIDEGNNISNLDYIDFECV